MSLYVIIIGYLLKVMCLTVVVAAQIDVLIVSEAYGDFSLININKPKLISYLVGLDSWAKF